MAVEARSAMGGLGLGGGGGVGKGPMFSCQKLVEFFFFFSWCLVATYNLQPRHGRARQDLSRRDTACICFGKVEEVFSILRRMDLASGALRSSMIFFNSDENFYP